MNKALFVMVAALAVSACGKKPLTLPAPPQNTQVVDHNIPVPVLCTTQLKRAKIKADSMAQKLKLEVQNAALRESLAQQQAYIIQLEAGIVGCGGKITD